MVPKKPKKGVIINHMNRKRDREWFNFPIRDIKYQQACLEI